MRVAIIHYHLRPGGVTKVIQSALNVLADRTICTVVIAGEAPSVAMPIPNSKVVEALAYADSPTRPPDIVLDDLYAAAKKALGGPPDLWHIHNHSLGKNPLLTEIVFQMAQQGQHLLLQPHDFAEDGRPANYQVLRRYADQLQRHDFGGWLYPQTTHVHYALINQRDRVFLKAAGVPERQLHYLPNAVGMPQQTVETPNSPYPDKRLILYPARGIRRKNLGEFLFWAALAEPDEIFALTRAPQNPRARPLYDQWVALAQALKLPVKFGLGEHWQGDFTGLLQSAYALISTSVAEGFGLAFLEPWLLNRPLIGRKLPEITDEFERSGLNLSSLYARLPVPLDWIGEACLHQEVRRVLEQMYAAYARPLLENDVERALNAAIHEKTVDFGRLHEPFQQEVLQRLTDSATARTELTPRDALITPCPPDVVQANRKQVQQGFHLYQYGETLSAIYQIVANAPVSSLDGLNAEGLLDRFLDPVRFCLLRT